MKTISRFLSGTVVVFWDRHAVDDGTLKSYFTNNSEEVRVTWDLKEFFMIERMQK